MSGCGLHCLKIEHITVRAGDALLLEDVNLHAHCGELTAVIGRNGAGEIHPSQGDPGGDSLRGEGDLQRAQRLPGIGQTPGGLCAPIAEPGSWLPGDGIRFGPGLYLRLPAFLPRRRKEEERLREHFSRFDADALLDKLVGRLSGGELQRVLLAVATRPHPDLLILDEPVSGVDNEGLRRFYEMLEQLRRTDDMVILLVSHDLDYVSRHADRVVLLDRSVQAAGTPEQVFSSPAFAAAFPKGGAAHA